MERKLGAVLWILWVWICCVRGVEVEQNPSALSLHEGTSSALRCSFSETMTTVQWFQQNPGGSLINLFYLTPGTKENGRLKSTFDSKERYSTLHIRDAQLEDSGTYLCAVQAGNNNRLFFGDGTQLVVKPNIKDPKPAVYELRDPQSKNSSICLFTDFDSQINVSKDMASDVFVFDKTVLDMKSMDSKSNGAIAWSNQSSFNCKDAFKENASYPSSDVPCDAKLIEKSFETDMNLNFQNLSVMGHRILLLKVAGFNLLMTLRLWSS